MINLDYNVILEFLGTAVLILFGGGVCANNSLKGTYAKGSGWGLITWGWGFAVLAGAYVSLPSGAHLNPAVTIALATSGAFKGSVIGYIIAQFLGAFVGAVLVFVMFKKHFDIEEDPGTLKGVFCTGPAIRSYAHNVISEAIGTFALILFILMAPVNAILGPIPVSFIIVAIGMSLGGATGYAINPARDLGPRIAHFLLPIKHKGSSDWGYAWVPVVGPILGALLAVGVYTLLKKAEILFPVILNS